MPLELEPQERKTGQELSTWQAIAIHLGVSIRTAKTYEQKYGMPVHRLPGSKSRVWAYAEELERWRRSHTSINVSSSGSDAPELAPAPEAAADFSGQVAAAEHAGQHVPTPQTSVNLPSFLRKFSRRTHVIAATAVLISTGLTIARHAGHRGQPSSYRVAAKTLFVLGPAGEPLWQHQFPLSLESAVYAPSAAYAASFVDLDADGSTEMLFRYSPQGRERYGEQLVCFNPDGSVRWTFSPGHRSMAENGKIFEPPYFINLFELITLPQGQRRLVVGSNHHFSYPDQVAVLDTHGQVISEYWHHGHLTHAAVADLNGDGVPELLLGGVDDDSGRNLATVVVFDARRIAGSSLSPTGTPHFLDLQPSSQIATLLFAKSEYSRYQEYNRVRRIAVHGDQIEVLVAEGINEDDQQIIYTLSRRLQPQTVVLADPLKAFYYRSRAAIDVSAETERLKQAVQIIRPH